MSDQLMYNDPERVAMSVLSDVLGIPHFTTSRGGTVRKDFVEAVAQALGATEGDLLRDRESSRPGSRKNKDEVLALAWQLARDEEFPVDQLSVGGTITNDHLNAILEGVMTRGLGQILNPGTGSGFHDLGDERRRKIAEQAVRDGQQHFRIAVLEAYDNRCAVTGANLPAALQAAHIAPYLGVDSNSVSNGLCLRSDIHAMFDRQMLAVNEDDLTIILSPSVLASTYQVLNGTRLRVPRDDAHRPDRGALARHRKDAGL